MYGGYKAYFLDSVTNSTVNNTFKISIGVLLPSRNYTLRASLESVLPWVVAAAVALPRYSWDILVGDTQCNSTIGPLTAVDMVYKYKPHMFLGSLRRQLNDNNEYKCQALSALTCCRLCRGSPPSGARPCSPPRA